MFFYKFFLQKNTAYNFKTEEVSISHNHYNVLKYMFYFNKINLFSLLKIPSFIVIQNQKNFFWALSKLCENNVKIIYITSFFSRNSSKAYSNLLNFNQLSQNTSTAVMILENNLSTSLVSKLVNHKLIFFKSISTDLDFSINIYPLFVNLSNYLNVFIYSNLIKLFLYNCKVEIILKKYKSFLKLFFKITTNLLLK